MVMRAAPFEYVLPLAQEAPTETTSCMPGCCEQGSRNCESITGESHFLRVHLHLLPFVP